MLAFTKVFFLLLASFFLFVVTSDNGFCNFWGRAWNMILTLKDNCWPSYKWLRRFHVHKKAHRVKFQFPGARTIFFLATAESRDKNDFIDRLLIAAPEASFISFTVSRLVSMCLANSIIAWKWFHILRRKLISK